MSGLLFSPLLSDLIVVPAGKFRTTIQDYQRDLQTGLVDIDFNGLPHFTLLFARGRLVNVYSKGSRLERLNPTNWLETLNGSSPPASMRTLAFPLQSVRIIKILIEQNNGSSSPASGNVNLEKQFADWMKHPVPALAHIHWPTADALALFPGKGIAPRYTLFIAPDQILHSAGSNSSKGYENHAATLKAGSTAAIYSWKENIDSAILYSSEPTLPAWAEYLLHYAFSKLVAGVLEKFEKLTGRVIFNQVIHDVNFTASAHDWNVSIHSSGINDQTIFTSAEAAAEVYARVLDAISVHLDSILGNDILNLLLRETAAHLSQPYRMVLKQYLPLSKIRIS